MAAGQAECGISFQDALTFAAAAGAPIVSVMAILQHTAQEIAVLASSDDHPAARPRRPDVRRLRLSERGADAEVRHQGRRRQGHVHDRDARYGRLRGALRQARRLRHHVRGLGGHRGRPSAASTCGRSQFGDYGFPDFYQVVLACDSRWLATHPDLARGLRRGDRPRVRAAADDPGRRGRAPGRRQNPGVFDGIAGAARRQPALPGRRRLPARRERRRRSPDPGPMAGLLGLPVRPGPPGRAGRQAARRPRRTTGRCSRTTTCRDDRAGPASRRWGPPAHPASGRSSSSGRPTSGSPASIRSRLPPPSRVRRRAVGLP